MKWLKKKPESNVEATPAPETVNPHLFDIRSIQGVYRTLEAAAEHAYRGFLNNDLRDQLLNTAYAGEKVLTLNYDYLQPFVHDAGGLDRLTKDLEERGFTVDRSNGIMKISGWADGQES